MLWQATTEPTRQMPCGEAAMPFSGRPADLTPSGYHNWIGRT